MPTLTILELISYLCTTIVQCARYCYQGNCEGVDVKVTLVGWCKGQVEFRTVTVCEAIILAMRGLRLSGVTGLISQVSNTLHSVELRMNLLNSTSKQRLFLPLSLLYKPPNVPIFLTRIIAATSYYVKQKYLGNS